jgi:uncharacterized protein YceH (UPF0502 family)
MKIKQVKGKDGKDVIIVERELSDEEKKADLETRVADLEKRVAALEQALKIKKQP